MLSIQADQRVLGYLGRALSLELTAVQQYSTQAQLCRAWGLIDASSKFNEEAAAELEHVDRVISRMLALGAAPNASQLRPVKAGRSLLEMLQHNYSFETELVRLYHDATVYCARNGDHDNRLFFETLMNEEKSHGSELEKWIGSLNSSISKESSQRVTF
jgi:bacterioferritin